MRLPLEGVRILEPARNVAVPLGTRVLAMMGAEVIKVEYTKHLDPGHTIWFPDNKPSGSFWNKGAWFHEHNTGKLGLAVDLGTKRGQAVFKDLAAISDVVVENFTPRVTRKWGLDYPALRKVNPSIIMLSNTGYGHDGPWENYKALGSHLEATTGVAHFTGYPGGPPMRTGIAYTDTPTGYMTAFAILAALNYRKRTGKGQWIDISMYEVGISLLGEALVDYSLNNRVPPRMGNGDHFMAPHGCYRCLGQDQWVTIAVSSDEEWRNLCLAMGKPSLAEDSRFADSLSRRKNKDELDSMIQAWTSQRGHDEVTHILQRVGVAAGAVHTNKEVLLDPQLKARGFFDSVRYSGELEDVGTRILPGRPWLMSGVEAGTRRHAPAIGQDNDRVLHDILGISDGDIEQMGREGVTAKEPINKEPPRNLTVNELKRQGTIIGHDPDYLEKLGLRK